MGNSGGLHNADDFLNMESVTLRLNMTKHRFSIWLGYLAQDTAADCLNTPTIGFIWVFTDGYICILPHSMRCLR